MPQTQTIVTDTNNRTVLHKKLKLLLESYLSFLVDDGHCICQFDVIEQAGQENVGHANQIVVLLLVKEGVGTFEIGPHHLDEGKK